MAIIFLRAIRRRETKGMIPFIIILGIGMILSFVQLINTGFKGLVLALFSAGWNCYVMIVIYSLYITMKNEKELQNNPQVHYQFSTMPYVHQPAQVISLNQY
jgi:hypothetical protein